jgi:hypothetical protein
MKQYRNIILPVGVSLTHDRGNPVVFAYVGGHGRVRMRAKRFSPNVVGGIEEAIELAAEWRQEALKDHQEAKAALPDLRRRRTTARKKASRKLSASRS